MTRRQELIDLLKGSCYSIKELAKAFRKPMNVIVDDLKHIGHKHKLTIFPAECNRCGFVFEDRKKLHKPSRCPKCKNERISDPGVMIE